MLMVLTSICFFNQKNKYHQTSDRRRTLVVIKVVDHSDVVGGSPDGAAPTTSSFSI